MTLAVVTLLGRPHEFPRVAAMIARARRLAADQWLHVVVADEDVVVPTNEPIVRVCNCPPLHARYEAVRRWLIDFSGCTHATFVDDDDIIAETHLRELELRAKLGHAAAGADAVFLFDGVRQESLTIPEPLAAWTQTIFSRDAFRAVAFEDCPAPDTNFMANVALRFGPIVRTGGITYACRIHRGNTRARFRNPHPMALELVPCALRSEWEAMRRCVG